MEQIPILIALGNLFPGLSAVGTLVVILFIATYTKWKNHNKIPFHNSMRSGVVKVWEVLNGHPQQHFDATKMTKSQFANLVSLCDRNGLSSGYKIKSNEKLMITIAILTNQRYSTLCMSQ